MLNGYMVEEIIFPYRKIVFLKNAYLSIFFILNIEFSTNF
jgi:hypothetical protein